MQVSLNRILKRTRQKEISANGKEEPSYSLLGGTTGFVFYWLALALPFVVYGSNTLLFLLYTWPFFLALLPVAVLIGVCVSMWCRGSLWKTVLLAGLLVILMFWAVFSFMTGW